jgi:hypothetical protein
MKPRAPLTARIPAPGADTAKSPRMCCTHFTLGLVKDWVWEQSWGWHQQRWMKSERQWAGRSGRSFLDVVISLSLWERWDRWRCWSRVIVCPWKLICSKSLWPLCCKWFEAGTRLKEEDHIEMVHYSRQNWMIPWTRYYHYRWKKKGWLLNSVWVGAHRMWVVWEENVSWKMLSTFA